MPKAGLVTGVKS